ncbi:MAG: 50S ribosomal protein L1 [Nitrososphaerales archaeon]
MLNAESVKQLVQEARRKAAKRNFNQAFELILTFKDLNPKQPININEIVFLPHPFEKKPKICVIASGDFALRARNSGADLVIEGDELDRLANQKREIRKLASNYDFFLAEASLMPKVGKILGQYFGPRGKMPTPIAPNAPLEQILERYRSAVRVRSRNQLAAACKVGDEKMADERIIDNALAVADAVVKKLPLGLKNIGGVLVKLTMSPPAAFKVK